MNLKNEVKPIDLDGLLDYKSRNFHYIFFIRGLVNSIFDAEIIDKRNSPIQYQKSTIENIRANDFKPNSLGCDEERLCDKHYQIPLSWMFNNTDKLGFLETGFINYLLIADKDLVILKGYRGTGKSELIRFVSDYVIDNIKHEKCLYYNTCVKKRVINLMINFKEGQFSSSESFVNDLQIRIFNQLGAEMTDLFDDKTSCVIDEFIKECENNNIPYWFNTKLSTDKWGEQWQRNDKEKYRFLFSLIQNEYGTTSPTNALNKLYEIIKFYHKFYPREKCCLSFIIDNCDQLETQHQNELIPIAKGISSNAGIQVIIPVRLNTFANRV